MDLQSLIPYLLVFLTAGAGAYFGAYLKRKGENLATKEDIGELTQAAEEIRAKISDDVWDRQKQWEMRRDAVYDAWRALRELETALIDLRSAHDLPIHNNNEDLKNHVLNMRHNSAAQFYACFTKFNHAKELADLVVGEKLTKHFSAYFQNAGPIAKAIVNGNAAFFTSEKMKDLAGISNEIRQEARRELKIKNADRVIAEP